MAKKLKIAFCQAFNPEVLIQYSVPPLGIGYLTACLKKRFADLEIQYFQSAEEILEFKPDLLGIASGSENFNEAQRIAWAAKQELDIPVILGGAHITALPHRLPEMFDIGVLGEGEQTIIELVALIKQGNLEPSELKKIKGICYHEHGGIRITDRRSPIPDLDILPYPERDFFRGKWAVSPHEMIHMVTSRGCPYRCKFCASSAIWGNNVRYFSADYFINEVEYLRNKYDPEDFYIHDDLFIADRERLKMICQKLKERRLHKGTFFNCSARVNLIDQEMIEMFAEVNFNYLTIGFEANTQKTLDYLNKQGTTPEINQQVFDLLSGYDVYVGGSFIIGSPVETWEDLDETYKFIERNRERIEFIGIYPLLPYPVTGVWQDALKRGLVSEDMDWSRLSFEESKLDLETMPYLCEHVPKQEFYEFYDKIYRLQKDIKQLGYIRYLKRKLWHKDENLAGLKTQLNTIKGSRLMRLALKFKDILFKLR